MGNKLYGFYCAITAVLALFVIVLSVLVLSSYVRNGGIPCWDLRLRYDEIQCIQSGVDPYDVFLGKVVTEKYRGYPRGDVPLDTDSSKQKVCTYPAWHTAFCYYYGWLPWRVLRVLSLGINVGCLIFISVFTYRMLKDTSVGFRVVFIISMIGLFSGPIAVGFLSGNYGFLMMVLSVAFAWALENKHDYLAGVCWAVMMFKPQVGVLFFWPLLISMRYKAMFTSIVLCIGGLLMTSVIIGKSPIDLLLQIPDSVPPLETSISMTSLWGRMGSLVGIPGSMLRMVAGGLACGVVCYFFKDAKRWYTKIVPVLAFIPVWSYSKLYDRVILWLFVLFACKALLLHRTHSLLSRVIAAIVLLWIPMTIFYNTIPLCRYLRYQLFDCSWILLLNPILYKLMVVGVLLFGIVRLRRNIIDTPRGVLF